MFVYYMYMDVTIIAAKVVPYLANNFFVFYRQYAGKLLFTFHGFPPLVFFLAMIFEAQAVSAFRPPQPWTLSASILSLS